MSSGVSASRLVLTEANSPSDKPSTAPITGTNLSWVSQSSVTRNFAITLRR